MGYPKTSNYAGKDGEGEGKTFEKAVLFPASAFLTYFCRSPLQLADLLEGDFADLAAEWKKLNYSPAMMKKRVATCYYYDLYRRQWRSGGNRGKMEDSLIELQLSSFAYTDSHQENPRPPRMQKEDVKVRWRRREDEPLRTNELLSPAGRHQGQADLHDRPRR